MFVGRKDSKKAAPEGLMPSVSMSADQIISLFEDKTIQPHDLAALLGAHSTSQQFNVDKTKAGFGQDSVSTEISLSRAQSRQLTHSIDTWCMGRLILQRDSAARYKQQGLQVPKRPCHGERFASKR